MLFKRRIIYVQVHRDHFTARLVSGGRTIRRDCYSLSQRPVTDFGKIRLTLRSIFKELASGFTFLKPWALLHFIPQHYVPSQDELKGFKQTAERSGVSFCWLSTWETAHTDRELTNVFSVV